MPESDPILRIEDLQVHFPITEGVILQRETGRVRAVNGVSLDLRAGEILGLVGESGCGKSTLARAALQLIRPTSGHVWYRGRDLCTLKGAAMREVRRDLQFVFQDPYGSLNPRMKAADIIAEPLLNLGIARGRVARDRAGELMEIVGLPRSWSQGYPHEFSGGQRQRVGIARALALDPEVIVADEAVSALDVSIQAQVLDLLADLKDRLNLSMIFITHDLGVIAHIADDVAVMYLGKVVEEASVTETFRNPLHPYTQALLRSIPQLDDVLARAGRKERLQTIRGMVPDPYSVLPGCTFHPRCPQFIPGVCDEIVPEVIEVEPGHTARCHLYGPHASAGRANKDTPL